MEYLLRFERMVLAMEVVSVAAVGLLWGSFLNVCIYRLPIYRLVFYPLHSFCPSCGKRIKWHDNIPVLSYALLRGRCRNCRARISPRYALVEILASAVMVAAFVKLRVMDGEPLAYFAIQCAILSALLVAIFTDLEHTIIPDEISLGGAILAPVVSFIYPAMHRTEWLAGFPHVNGLVVSLVSLAIGAGLIYGIGVLGKVAFRKEAMGFGDVKLLAFISAALGYKVAILVVFAGAFITLFYVLIHVVHVGLRYGLKELSARGSEVPFGPGLCTAAALGIFFRVQADYCFDAVVGAARIVLGRGM